MGKVLFKYRKSLGKAMTSDALGDQLEIIAQPVFDAAFEDPNEDYKASLQIGRFKTRGRHGRIGIQIGAAPELGDRVEAKRGTLARALGSAGL